MNYSFNQFTNSTLRKGCFHKNRYDSAEEASKDLYTGLIAGENF